MVLVLVLVLACYKVVLGAAAVRVDHKLRDLHRELLPIEPETSIHCERGHPESNLVDFHHSYYVSYSAVEHEHEEDWDFAAAAVEDDGK